MEDTRLLLLAQEAGEVPTISALVQSATLRCEDAGYDKRGRRLVLLLNRYRWEAKGTRIRTALRVESVTKVTRRNWPGAGAILELLALRYEGDALMIDFAGSTALRVEIEVPDLILEDMSAPWSAGREPSHD